MAQVMALLDDAIKSDDEKSNQPVSEEEVKRLETEVLKSWQYNNYNLKMGNNVMTQLTNLEQKLDKQLQKDELEFLDMAQNLSEEDK